MDQNSEHGTLDSGHEVASWGAKATQYALLVMIAPLYLAAGAGGEAAGAALTGASGFHNLLSAAAAMYILHRCFWD